MIRRHGDWLSQGLSGQTDCVVDRLEGQEWAVGKGRVVELR